MLIFGYLLPVNVQLDYLEQETVAGLLLDSGLDTERVGNSQVITDDLNAALAGEVGPSFPVILIEGILDGDDGVLGDVAQVEISKLLARDPLGGVGVGVLEVKIVLALLVELGRSNIESDLNLALVTGLLDGLGEELKGLIGTRDVGGETSLVTNVDGCTTTVKRVMLQKMVRSLPSIPYLALITFLRVWYVSVPIFMASVKLVAPVGRSMNSWKASLLPAWEPPLITLKAGVGRVKGALTPARSATCW